MQPTEIRPPRCIRVVIAFESMLWGDTDIHDSGHLNIGRKTQQFPNHQVLQRTGKHHVSLAFEDRQVDDVFGLQQKTGQAHLCDV